MTEPQHQRQRSQDGGGIPRSASSSTGRHHRRNGSTPSSRQSITLSQLERQWSVGNVYDSFGTEATDEFIHAWASASNLTGGESFHVANPTPSFHTSIGPVSSTAMAATAMAAASAVTSADATEQLWLEQAASTETEVSSIIHDEARVVAWNTVLELCRTHPRHAQYAGSDGWTALHHACNRRCNRQDVVEALVKAYPAALVDLEEKGMTPLHYACRFKAPKDTVRILLNLYPDMGHLAVSKRDKIGRTPLWYAVRYDAPTGVVDMLLDIDSSVILEEDKAGESPLSLVWDIWAEKFEGKRTLAPYLEPISNVANSKKMFPEERKAQFFALLEVQKKLRARWETTNLFLKANFGLANATADRTYRMLHATASIPCHSTLFLLAKTLYPEQASELEDADLLPQGGKQTALHLAAASVASGEAAKTVVTALLELNPAAVQLADSAQGSLPLHIFVERKNHWVHDGIRDVYQAYPAALQQGDATGRLPLHRAAQANQHGSGPGGSVILELMEAWPQAAAQPDQSGRLALHYVAECGETWEDESEAIYRGHEAAVRVRAGPSARLPLHMAAASPDARRSLLEMLVELHPRGAMQTERTGKLPLHLACESGKLWDKGVGAIYDAYEAAIREPEQNPRRWLALQMAAASPNTSADVIQQLASLYPEAAAQVDADGRCALHWACESGKEWDLGLKDILHANPLANICEDKAGMLPFHIAALKQCGSNNDAGGVLTTGDAQTPHAFQTRSRSSSVMAEMEGNADDVDAEATKVEILYQLLMVDPNILPKH
jgi:ankyrin repeat protein